ncbi:AMP-binding protein [Micromonospora aurantiaca]|uniref:AMP-binding protein n=1 Tax=Micromonospora aurantiaca (nom. illeg.) TaxID=47850 RepID=UPI0033B8208B
MSGTLLAAVLAAAAHHPERTAVRADDATLSWAGLLALAGRYLTGYREHGVTAGDRVAVLREPGAHAVAAALAAFALRAAYVPLDPRQPAARIATLLAAADPRLVTGDDPAGPHRRHLAADAVALRPVASLDDTGEPTDVAYVVHTSGSTGTPKAVQVEHRNLGNLLADLDELAPVPRSPVGTWWTRPSFDVAVWECFAPLHRGGTLVVVPEAARHDGAALAAFLDRSGAHSGYVPPAFLPDLLALLRADPAALAGLRRLLVGVEPIPRTLLEDIARSRPELNVVNGYGPAEATVCCTRYVVPRDGAVPGERTPIGTPVRGTRIHLRRTDGTYATTGAGELVVSGAAVARGYLRPPAGPSPFMPMADGEPGYATGDLVRALPDGNLLFLGRVDRQLKVRGFRIEPAEVEAVLGELPGVHDVVVGGRTVDGLGQVVAAYVVPTPGAELTERTVREHAARRLPGHAVPAVVTLLPELPLTPHGKYDHDHLAALPLPVATTAEDDSDLVRTAWRRVLPVADIRDGDDFVSLGGTSLAAARAAAWLRERTGVPLTGADILQAPSVAALAGRIAAAGPGTTPAGDERPTGARRAPLTDEQLGLWLHDEMQPGSPLYVEPVCFGTDDPVDHRRLVDALRRAIAGHPAFGAGLDSADGLPELVLYRHDPPVELVELPDGAALDAAVAARAYRPFDTAAEPLLRATVLHAGPRTELLLVWHHLVVDAWSVRLLLDDLDRTWTDPAWSPSPAPATVCDLARRRAARIAMPSGRAAVDAAVARIRDVPVPAPRRTGDRTVRERAVGVTAGALLAAGGGTVTELTAAAYARALGALCGPDSVVLGCASATREDADEFAVAGYAVNSVLLRADDLHDGWPETLTRVRRELRRAVAEQAPFTAVAREVLRGTGTRPGDFPAFYLDSVAEPDLVTGALRWRRRELHRPVNRFPVCLTLRQHADGTLTVLVESDGRLLDAAATAALATDVTDQLEAHVQGEPDVSHARAAAGQPGTDRFAADGRVLR